MHNNIDLEVHTCWVGHCIGHQQRKGDESYGGHDEGFRTDAGLSSATFEG